jgi:tryptophan halogenase
MIQRVLILGGGSAGFLAAITLRAKVPDLAVTVLRSKEIGIIGVGEATTIGVPQHLHGYLGLDLTEFYRLADPMWKLGIRFLWGKRPYFDYAFGYQLDTQYQALPRGTAFYCPDGPFDYVGIPSGLMTLNHAFLRQPDGRPLVGNDLAYHLENEKFVSYLEAVAARYGVTVRDDTVVEVQQDERGITGLRLASGPVETADLFVDCSGFASVLLGQALREPFVSFKSSLYCDRAVVGGWPRTDEPIQPYTTAETMDVGWCWRIDHVDRINRGYVHSSAFISEAAAEAEFRAKNPRVTATRFVRYLSGRYQRGWVKNVVAIGNSGGFVEPLESTGLSAICGQSQALAETLADCDRQVRPSLVTQYNKRFARNWDHIRNFLAIHYRFNTRLDMPFWRDCRAHGDLAGAAEFVDFFRENGPSVVWRTTLLDASDQFGMEGYLSLLVGQQVPYEAPYRPSARDLATWQTIREAIRVKVQAAFTVREALAAIHTPGWQWPAGLYQRPLGVNR